MMLIFVIVTFIIMIMMMVMMMIIMIIMMVMIRRGKNYTNKTILAIKVHSNSEENRFIRIHLVKFVA